MPPYAPIYLRIPPYTSVYLRICPYTSVYLRMPPYTEVYLRIRLYSSVYIRLRPHTSTHLLMPPYTVIDLCTTPLHKARACLHNPPCTTPLHMASSYFCRGTTQYFDDSVITKPRSRDALLSMMVGHCTPRNLLELTKLLPTRQTHYGKI